MDESKIKFGDRFFLYGQFMEQDHWDEYGFENPQYNAVMGYVPFGGYIITPQKTTQNGVCLPGFVVDWPENFCPDAVYAVLTPFYDKELLDVTELLALQSPYLSGSKVWMPL